MQETFTIYSDGGARGNPGPAAAGIFLEKTAEKLRLMCGKYLGENTNNFAEYQGVILGLEKAAQLAGGESKATTINFYLDSALIVNQLNGTFRLKAANLLSLFSKVRQLEVGFAQVTYTHIPREQNKKADAAVNRALDLRDDFEEKI